MIDFNKCTFLARRIASDADGFGRETQRDPDVD
jgi:hypothetical protein